MAKYIIILNYAGGRINKVSLRPDEDEDFQTEDYENLLIHLKFRLDEIYWMVCEDLDIIEVER